MAASIAASLASHDVENIMELAFMAVIFSVVHTLEVRFLALLLSFLVAWLLDFPRQFVKTQVCYILLHLALFRHMKETEEFFSALRGYVSRDRPPRGLPGGEIANMITKFLILLLYVITSVAFHNIYSLAFLLWGYRVWILGTSVILTVLTALAHYSARAPRGLGKLRLKGLFEIGLVIYNAPFLVKENFRHGKHRLGVLLRPLLELSHLWSPMLLHDYKKLNVKEKQIRLIRLTRKYPGCELRCSLRRVSLSEAPPYEAISYTWGSSVKDHIVFFDGKWLPTTRNVYKVLDDRSSYVRSRWLWIDAVCINQDDINEKNAQVQLMGEIYRTAERVVVWLDDAEITHTEFTEATSFLEIINFNSMLGHFDELVQSEQPPVIGLRGQWNSLNRLLSHPYWHRVWILQEVALAREVHILYGGKYVAWDHLSTMMANLLTPAMKILLVVALNQYELDEPSRITQGAIQVCHIELFRRYGADKVLRSLADCIVDTAMCEATNPRDRIFALQNLINPDRAGRPPNIMNIDYRLELEDSYRNTAQYLARHEPRFLLIFAGIGWERQTAKLRSWVPDFARLPTSNLCIYRLDPSCRRLAGGISALHLGLRNHAAASNDGVTVQAAVLSEISGIANVVIELSTLMDFSKLREKTECTMEFLKHSSAFMSQLAPLYEPTGQPVHEAYMRTIVMDREFSEDEITPTVPQYESLCRRHGLVRAGLVATLLKNSSAASLSSPATDGLAQQDQRSDEKKTQGEFEFQSGLTFGRTFARACAGRKFAVTQSGMMGLVPPNTKKGDLLCVVPGFEMPLLLRPHTIDPVTYQLVGVCYMHGIMDGEVLERKSASIREVIIT